eukprot:Opistho-2@26572
MAHKLIAQLIVMGTQVVARAFVDAYKEAATNAAKHAAQSGRTTAAVRSSTMTVQEARQILNISETTPPAEIKQKFDHLYNVNDKAKGGSFYLQSKVVRAKEAIEEEIGPLDKPQEAVTSGTQPEQADQSQAEAGASSHSGRGRSKK